MYSGNASNTYLVNNRTTSFPKVCDTSPSALINSKWSTIQFLWIFICMFSLTSGTLFAVSCYHHLRNAHFFGVVRKHDLRVYARPTTLGAIPLPSFSRGGIAYFDFLFLIFFRQNSSSLPSRMQPSARPLCPGREAIEAVLQNRNKGSIRIIMFNEVFFYLNL